MPTGYTQKIIDGEVQTPKDFLHLCLRAFGVLVDFMDDPLDPNRDYTQDIINRCQKDVDYAKKKVEEYKEELKKYQQISDEDLYQEWVKKETESRDWAIESMKTVAKTNDLLGRFHRSIEDWECSKEYEGVKSFALEQLEISTEDTGYEAEILERTKDLSREHFDTVKDELRNSYIASASRMLESSEDMVKDAIKRQSERVSFYHFFKQEIEKLK